MGFFDEFLEGRQIAGGAFAVPHFPETDVGFGMTLDGARVREPQVVTDDRNPVPAGMVDLFFSGVPEQPVGGPPRDAVGAPFQDTDPSSLMMGGDEAERQVPEAGDFRELTTEEEQEAKNRQTARQGRDPEMSDNELRQRRMLRKIAAGGLRKVGASGKDINLQLGRRI